MVNKSDKIYIAGHEGMVGSSVFRALKARGYYNLIGKSRKDLDLRKQKSLEFFFNTEKPDIVINAAATVGGILANKEYPYNFLMDNLLIQNNLINIALKSEVKKFVFLGSSCIYPKFSPQPIKEKYLLEGSLEQTNEMYAIAKIAGIKACQAIREQFEKDYVCLMPTNLYGYNDNFNLKSCHVLPSMIRKFHEAKQNKQGTVNLWGSGNPLRDFLFVDDLADAIIFTLENKFSEHLYNVGTGIDITIKELAQAIQKVVGYKCKINWDASMPDGTPRKLLDVSKMKTLGWSYSTELIQGIEKTYRWFLKNITTLKSVSFEKY